MIVKFACFISVFLLSLSAFADPVIYGKIWITAELQDNEKGRESDLVSNASRIGIKGDLNFQDNMKGFFQIEYEVDTVDGTADESKGKSFKQRNSFLGLKGSYGTIFLGTHDTAFKKSQQKIDLFNDLVADIKNVLHGENRMKDFVGYTTPTFGSGFSGTFNAIKGSEGLGDDKIGDYLSYSLSYKTEKFYSSIAIDTKMKGYDNIRYSIQIPIDIYRLGFIYQASKKLSSGIKEDGYVVSTLRQVGRNGSIKVQIAESDMKISSGKQVTIGYDHKLSKDVKVFFFYTDFSAEVTTKEGKILAIGFEYKF